MPDRLVFERTADYVLAVLFGERSEGRSEHYWQAVRMGLHDALLPDGQWREAYRALIDLTYKNIPAHPTTLEAYPRVPVDWVVQLLAVWGSSATSTLQGAVFEANVKQLIDLGVRFGRAEVLARYAQMVQAGGDLDDLNRRMHDELNALTASRVEGETADQLAVAATEQMRSPLVARASTGLAAWDEAVGGIGEGDLFAVAAADKMRKTTFVLNALVRMAQRGESVAILMLESTRMAVASQLIAMLGTAWLDEQRLLIGGQLGALPYATVGLPSGFLRTYGSAAFNQLQRQAAEAGVERFKQLGNRLRVYDASPAGGSLSDLASIQRVVDYELQRHAPRVIAIDNVQAISARGTDYERMITVVPELERMARRNGVALIVISQLNQSAIEAGPTTYSVGARGGAVLDANADYVWTLRYNIAAAGRILDRDELFVRLHKTRYGQPAEGIVRINPPSGWILVDGQWRAL